MPRLRMWGRARSPSFILFVDTVHITAYGDSGLSGRFESLPVQPSFRPVRSASPRRPAKFMPEIAAGYCLGEIRS